MPDLEIEVIGNETAEAVLVVDSNLDLEVHLDSVAAVGSVPAPETVEVTFPGPLMIHDATAVKNEGNVPGIILLEAADPIPGGTPVGTVVLRKS